MLDLIRKNASSFVVKGLLLIIIFAFVGTIGLIWGGGGYSGLTKKNSAVRINSRTISLATYNQALENKINFYRRIYREGFSNKLMESLKLKEMVMNELIEKALLLEWADKLGFKISDDELRKRIYSYPVFQQEGIFNPKLYRQLLSANRITAAVFEQEQRETGIIGKLQFYIADQVKVSDEELRQEYRQANEKINAQYLVFDPINYTAQVKVTDNQISSYFDGHKEDYRVAEQRRVEYLLVDSKSLEDKVKVEAADIEDYYYDHDDEYTATKKVRASHILIKLPPNATPEMDKAARKKAEEIRRQLEKGADFAKLATKFSDDKASAAKGGDLGYFTRGKLVPPFEQAAFSMEKGQLSQPVKTDYGYHIIKVTDIKPSDKKPLAEVRSQIEARLKREQASVRAQEKADTLYSDALAGKDLQQLAQTYSLKLKRTGFFSIDGGLPELGKAYQFYTAAFGLDPEAVSPPVKLTEGYALLKLLEVKPSYIPPLEEVREKVKQAVIEQQAQRLAHKQAEAARSKLRSNIPLKEVAKTYGLPVLDSGAFSRQGFIKGIGSVKDWAPKLFAIKPGQVSPLLEREADNKYYLIVINEALPIDENKFQQDKKEIFFKLQRQKTEVILRDWINRLINQADIKVNQSLIR